jgi:hypothetical protein
MIRAMIRPAFVLLALAGCSTPIRPEPPKDPSNVHAVRMAKLQERAAKDFGCDAREITITPVTLEDVAGQGVPVLADARCGKAQRYRYSWGDMAWYPTYAEDEDLVPKRQ